MYMRAAVEIAGRRPPPHLPFDFDSSIMVSKLTANRTGVVDDCESTCSPIRQGIFIVFLSQAGARNVDRSVWKTGAPFIFSSSVVAVKWNRDKREKCIS